MKTLLVALLVSYASTTLAAEPKRPKARPAATRAPEALDGLTSAAMLAKAQALYDALEYDSALEVVEALLARPDVTFAERLEAFRLQGCAIGIVQDPIEAEPSFRALLRARPDYELPAELSPKIVAVFRKVQAEERALSQKLREVERAHTISLLKLSGSLPELLKGGRAVPFSFRVTDPAGVVETVRLPYRRQGERDYSSLVLTRGENGEWTGTLPADLTASEQGFTLEYYVAAADTGGPLMSQGGALSPSRVTIEPGQVLIERPRPVPLKAFVASSIATGALALTAATLGIVLNVNQAQYRALAQSQAPGLELVERGAAGDRLAITTNVFLISTGVAIVTTTILAFFTQFSASP